MSINQYVAIVYQTCVMFKVEETTNLAALIVMFVYFFVLKVNIFLLCRTIMTHCLKLTYTFYYIQLI